MRVAKSLPFPHLSDTHAAHFSLGNKKLLQNTNLRFAASFSNVGILTVSEKDHYKLGFGLLKAYGSADWM